MVSEAVTGWPSGFLAGSRVRTLATTKTVLSAAPSTDHVRPTVTCLDHRTLRMRLIGPGKQVLVDGDPGAPSPVPAMRTPGVQYGLLMAQCEDESSQSVAECYPVPGVDNEGDVLSVGLMRRILITE